MLPLELLLLLLLASRLRLARDLRPATFCMWYWGKVPLAPLLPTAPSKSSLLCSRSCLQLRQATPNSRQKKQADCALRRSQSVVTRGKASMPQSKLRTCGWSKSLKFTTGRCTKVSSRVHAEGVRAMGLSALENALCGPGTTTRRK